MSVAPVVTPEEYQRRGMLGVATRRHAHRQSIEVARELAETVEPERGMSHVQANRLFTLFCREAALSGDRVSGCAMKVGV